MTIRGLLLAALLSAMAADAAVVARATASRTWTVCPAKSAASGCQFRGDGGIQAAVDRAASGDTILLKSGRYSPGSHRDIPYKEITVRGYVAIDGKDLAIVGEDGTVLDGSTGLPTTAIAIRRAEVTLHNLEITGFRFAVEEDDIYEGHGVFLMDASARLDNVTIRKFQKMGLTGRGNSLIEAVDLQVLDGHVAIWLHETAFLRLRNAVIRGNDSSAIAAYDRSVAQVASSVIDGNLDDGLYSEQQAVIFATNSIILRNRPIAAHALEESRIQITFSALYGNEANVGSRDRAQVHLGPGIVEADPRLGPDYRLLPGSPLMGKGDPDLGNPPGTAPDIGLYGSPGGVR